MVYQINQKQCETCLIQEFLLKITKNIAHEELFKIRKLLAIKLIIIIFFLRDNIYETKYVPENNASGLDFKFFSLNGSY
jgi:hypothetical protein